MIPVAELLRRAGITTFENDQLVWGALRAGAAGYVLKRAPASELVDAIRLVHGREAVLFPDALRRITAPRSSVDLTSREMRVLRLLARGQNNAEIAKELFVSRETVKTHVRNVLDKLAARDRTQAVVRAYELGIVFAGIGVRESR